MDRIAPYIVTCAECGHGIAAHFNRAEHLQGRCPDDRQYWLPIVSNVDGIQAPLKNGPLLGQPFTLVYRDRPFALFWQPYVPGAPIHYKLQMQCPVVVSSYDNVAALSVQIKANHNVVGSSWLPIWLLLKNPFTDQLADLIHLQTCVIVSTIDGFVLEAHRDGEKPTRVPLSLPRDDAQVKAIIIASSR